MSGCPEPGRASPAEKPQSIHTFRVLAYIQPMPALLFQQLPAKETAAGHAYPYCRQPVGWEQRRWSHDHHRTLHMQGPTPAGG
jgi:hypothetical protein